MKRLQRAAVLAQLADKLAEQGSWCGETHMQKAVYLLQELADAKLGYDFILYKHGPFSFELRDDITGLCADGLFELRSREPYGPTFVTTPVAQQLRDNFKVTIAQFSKQVGTVAEVIGDKGVVELERIATALFVTLEDTSRSGVEDRADRLTELKPHVKRQEAKEAVEKIDDLRKTVNQSSKPACA